ncbi:hypothetical protein V1226_06590 [Lachnospiraceae bacterium JLR.KK009]|nr:hypothetical protein C810_00911 [Lachnospiraceae bacterium A2]
MGEEKEKRMGEGVAKHTVKDSVFTSLFKEKKYLIELYRAIHPEDREATEDDLQDVTISNVLVNDLYNDIGFRVGSTLLILIESQSTWTVNIIFRALMYLVQTYREYFKETKQDIYKSRKLKMPAPELYVIYTGARKSRPGEISLSEEFFDGKETCLDVKVKMIYDGKEGDIINQYVRFTKVCNEQVSLYGRTRKAIKETIRICKDSDVLREYLENKEQEVLDMLMELYDQEEVLKSYVQSEKYEAVEEAAKETAKRMLKDGTFSIDKIAEFVSLPIEVIQEIAALQSV